MWTYDRNWKILNFFHMNHYINYKNMKKITSPKHVGNSLRRMSARVAIQPRMMWKLSIFPKLSDFEFSSWFIWSWQFQCPFSTVLATFPSLEPRSRKITLNGSNLRLKSKERPLFEPSPRRIEEGKNPTNLVYTLKYLENNVIFRPRLCTRGIRTDTKFRLLTKIDLNVMHLINLCKFFCQKL